MDMILGHDSTYVMNGDITTSRFEGLGSMISSAARLPALVPNLVSESRIYIISKFR